MPKIIFIEPSGARREIDAIAGETGMQAATRNGVDGIIGECGGSCMCATCHCYTNPATAHLLVPPADMEADTLEFVAHDVRPESRLSCQIKLTDAHEGLVLHVVGGHG